LITPGGNLSASFVIHVVIQDADESVSAHTLEVALVNGLRRATEWGVESLALPPLGLGPGALPPEEAARILVDVLQRHLGKGQDPRELTVVVENEYEEDLYVRSVAVVERVD
jgi:O-acetyl-ADP-ribose deacetylase (regulator of RNase III)